MPIDHYTNCFEPCRVGYQEWHKDLAFQFNFFEDISHSRTLAIVTYDVWCMMSSLRSVCVVHRFPWILSPNIHRRWGQEMLRATDHFQKIISFGLLKILRCQSTHARSSIVQKCSFLDSKDVFWVLGIDCYADLTKCPGSTFHFMIVLVLWQPASTLLLWTSQRYQRNTLYKQRQFSHVLFFNTTVVSLHNLFR